MKAGIYRHRVINPALGVPRSTRGEPKARQEARLVVCRPCRFYVFSAGQHRCTHIDRKCERLDLRRAGEVCPLDAWPSPEVSRG
jgi:hypothetical protein